MLCGGNHLDSDPLGLQFCATDMYIWIYLHSSTCKHRARLAPFVEDVVPFPMNGFDFFIKNQVECGFISGTLIPFHCLFPYHVKRLGEVRDQ